MILINTIGKNLEKLDQFSKIQFEQIFFLISSTDKYNLQGIQKKIKKTFKSFDFEFGKNLIEVKTDDINDVFLNSVKIINKFKIKEDIIVNPSGGSTAMRVGLYRAGILNKCSIQILVGNRNKEHQLINSRFKTVNRSFITFYEKYLQASEEFSKYNYYEARIIMESLKDNGKLEQFTELFISICKFFEDWNNFSFSDLKNQIDNHLFSAQTKNYLYNNFIKKANTLSDIEKKDKEKDKIHPLWIPEFWNSAERSYLKRQYSECLLKILRFIESIVQNLLFHTMKINSSEEKMAIIACFEYLTEHFNQNKKYKLSAYFVNNSEDFKSLAYLRNSSIFVHGYNSINLQDIEHYRKIILNNLIPLLSNPEISKDNLGHEIDFKQLPNNLEEIGINFNDFIDDL